MSKGIEAVRARYTGLDRQRIEVPEWGGQDGPFVLWAKPWTLEDERGITRAMRDDNPEGFAAVVLAKAEDEDGAPMFDARADKPVIMRIGEAHVLKRVAYQVMAGTADVETARGNSAPTASSGGDSASPGN